MRRVYILERNERLGLTSAEGLLEDPLYYTRLWPSDLASGALFQAILDQAAADLLYDFSWLSADCFDGSALPTRGLPCVTTPVVVKGGAIDSHIYVDAPVANLTHLQPSSSSTVEFWARVGTEPTTGNMVRNLLIKTPLFRLIVNASQQLVLRYQDDADDASSTAIAGVLHPPHFEELRNGSNCFHVSMTVGRNTQAFASYDVEVRINGVRVDRWQVPGGIVLDDPLSSLPVKQPANNHWVRFGSGSDPTDGIPSPGGKYHSFWDVRFYSHQGGPSRTEEETKTEMFDAGLPQGQSRQMANSDLQYWWPLLDGNPEPLVYLGAPYLDDGDAEYEAEAFQGNGNYSYNILYDGANQKIWYCACSDGCVWSDATGTNCSDGNPLPEYLTDPSLAIDYLIERCNEGVAESRSQLYDRLLREAVTAELSETINAYRNACFSGIEEDFKFTYRNYEHHYTLYYYDQAGQLVQTVPPEGFVPRSDSYVQSLEAAAAGAGQQLPDLPSGAAPHGLRTVYRYNALGQPEWKKTPDDGVTWSWYDDLGRPRLSRDAEQGVLEEGKVRYSFVRYDSLGRTVESGELESADALLNRPEASFAKTEALYELTADFAFPDFAAPPEESICAPLERTLTHYDRAVGYSEEQDAIEAMLDRVDFQQENLRNRVSWSERFLAGDEKAVRAFYSYDAHGNVKALAKSLPDERDVGAEDLTRSLVKKTVYEYDLLTGNVNRVDYQPQAPEERFVHRYAYDADNRLVSAETSLDGYLWEQDATYQYYAHGPLARVEVGHHKVQGFDYYYTLQGWIKGVNMPSESGSPNGDLDPEFDLAQDGQKEILRPDGSRAGVVNAVARDEFGYALGYYAGDYDPIGEYGYGTSDPQPLRVSGPVQDASLWQAYGSAHATSDGLYNGNISWMVTSVPELQRSKGSGMQAMLYRYDQLHRITGARSTRGYAEGSGWTRGGEVRQLYDTDYSYDGNGNLLTLDRAGKRISAADNGAAELSDQLSYVYATDADGSLLHNRLLSVENGASDYLADGTPPEAAPVELPRRYLDQRAVFRSGDVIDASVNEVVFREAVVLSGATVAEGEDILLMAESGSIGAGFSYDGQGEGSFELRHVAYDPNDPEQTYEARQGGKPMYDAAYAYDPVGNLVREERKGADGTVFGITTIEWTADGKVRRVDQFEGETAVESNQVSALLYRYDPSGNRVSKTYRTFGSEAKREDTYYVRDAQGNVLATYKQDATAEARQEELYVYGSSRLGALKTEGRRAATPGTMQRKLGHKRYEAANHLGNVLATFTDYKAFFVEADGRGFFKAEVASASDYYPFGQEMDGRSLSHDDYRFGFNAQEKSLEIAKDHYTAQFWEYDARVARRWNVDPVTKLHESPFACFANNPMLFIDPSGADTTTNNYSQSSVSAWFQTRSADASQGDMHTVSGTPTFNRYGRVYYAERNVSMIYHEGNDFGEEGWYSPEAYEYINRDWNNGQVLAPRSYFEGLFANDVGNRYFGGWQVGENGYLTGQRWQPDDIVVRGVVPEFFSDMTPAGRTVKWSARAIAKATKHYAKKGPYTIYQAVKTFGGRSYLYIGKAKTGIKYRYSQKVRKAIEANAVEGLENIPNNATALGVEQAIMRLNGWEGRASGSRRVLGNNQNATTSEIMEDLGVHWLNQNVPNWRTDFKF